MSRSGTRAVLRIGWRNIRRNRWRNVLVVLLVVLPVAAMSAAVTYFTTTTPSPDARATDFMGRGDLIVYPSAPSADTDELIRRLPADSTVEPFAWIDDRLVLAGRQLRVTALAADPDGLSSGRVTLLEGRYPATSEEVAISRSVATTANLEIGQLVELARAGQYTVVGIIEVPLSLSARHVLLHASMAEDPRWADERSWLVQLPPEIEMPSEPALPFEIESSLHSRFDANTRTMWAGDSSAAKIGTLVFGALALILTVLVASAAFAVSIRRRQRELGMLAAIGASRRQLAGTVAGEGFFLGLVGAVIGIAVGVGVIALAAPWLDQLTDRRNPPLQSDPLALLLAGGLGAVAALVAGGIPAWSAARVPVVVALSGRRPPQASARRVLVLGLVLIATGGAMTAAGAAQLLVEPASGTAFMLLAGGAIAGVLGFGASSPWLIERLEWIGRRLPLSPRIALRDAARARSRSAPIVTAMLAGLAATIAMSAFISSSNAMNDAQWRPWARADNLFLEGDEAGFVGPDVARELGAVAGAPLATVANGQGEVSWAQIVYFHDGTLPDMAADESDCEGCLLADRLVVGDGELLRALGAESAIAALAEGRAVILTDAPLPVSQALFQAADETGDSYVVPIAVTTANIGIDPTLGALPSAVIPSSLAAELGLAAYPFASSYVMRLGRQVTELDVARAGLMVADSSGTWADAPLGPPRPDYAPRLAITILSFVLALGVAAIAVALGESESRPDQRTLLAVGADPRIRRRIVASRAGVLGLLAGLLALPAGLLPAWGLLASREVPLVVPLTEVIVTVLLLPIVAILGALLLSRPIPSWSAFREAGS
jgi:putative ABC transport system permease protein